MKDALLKKVATKLNDLVDIPMLPEWLEQFICEAAVKQANVLLIKYLPPEIYELLYDVGGGLIDEHVAYVKEKIIGYVNPKVDIPYLDEDQEAMMMNAALDVMLSYLYKGASLPEVE